ncbi:helix-turn-helix transcriptional regulator [Prevotella lacticifex]|uniref:Transcriptional regulator n=1 Tax=Prevotella lacticifex TaxID=2854755 RepID=A0A9R1CZ43_9BACT|nr:helix-turn-helix transcriptional regulator [Prevotella lacticifex]GJG36722.1 transcriptional regulator [Prevotella lacticifex]GJG38581.1 transcriptional regulator [Prevotella lacticifex]GJG42736.1 transcriptional regulator [Prevotella lacticifex]GJG44938.1 transcriptional regulator [Prevotella lacticifex]GJG49087.1 transcriptional regulator [Prevotella lacticifex]
MENHVLNRIKVVLCEKNKTAKWLAKELGKDPTTISKWCTNQSQPSIEILIKISELLNVDYTELIRVEGK